MELKHLLVSSKPREISGSRASQGFSYQRAWALCLLIELHLNSRDYAILFDYLDDVVVLDSAMSPCSINFYQVKKRRNGVVSLKSLLHRQKIKGEAESRAISVLGKMVSNYLAFPVHTASVNHVTNVRYNLKMADGESCLDKMKICLSELNKEDVGQVKLQMMEEHNLVDPPKVESITFFLVSPLSPDDTESHVRGKLCDFLETVLPGRPVAIIPLYQCLASEIERLNNRVTDAKNFEDIIKEKGLTKADVTALMSDLPVKIDVDKLLSFKWLQLTQDGMTYPEIEEWKRAVKLYELERTNKANIMLSQAEEAVKSAMKQIEAQASYKTLREKIFQTVEIAKKSVKADVLTRCFLEGIALYHEVCDE